MTKAKAQAIEWPNKWYQSRWLIGLVLRSIYEKHRKSSQQDGSSGESRGGLRWCDGRILKCGEGAREVVLRSIYEKHRKSSRQGGSSGESRDVVRRCDGRILKM
ncbi:hypothetical protein PIB30_093443 [Stylosanthes scabra]|uniref:Uncharacterized protein n=1 Tax=Stylosanthes scabra TaxID=79078 RepID=A0ABU6XWA4_9FABA|nr:hypothetical protein [Stylosanthes scabra]